MTVQGLFTSIAGICLYAALAVIQVSDLGAAELPPVADRQIEYSRDVKPILSKHCLSCHGSTKQESGLRLDRKSHLLNGGDLGKVISPGKSADSRLIKYVAGTDPDHLMPPEGDRLSSEQIGILRAWIDQGIAWPESEDGTDNHNSHWAYQPIRSPAISVLKRSDLAAQWASSPIDLFVLAELEKKQLTPSPIADRQTLIRRLSLDLRGLTPSIEEVDAFVNDTRPNAYEMLVDQMLASKHFGERWGRHWLDMARYADSDGYEKDNARPDAYRWRDWVIDAVNSDMPFDQFTIEQLAGDLLPNATPMQKLATAFHRQTLTNTEGGTDQEQFRVEACFDRTETTGAVWLGLTVGCARCHSHKYDAISQREYYQFFSVFNNGDEQTTVVPKSDEEVAAYAKAKTAHDLAMSDVTKELKVQQATLGPAVQKWETSTQEQLARIAANPLKLHPIESPSFGSDGGVTFTPQKDGSVIASGPNPEKVAYTVTGKATIPGITAIRIDALSDASLPSKGPGRVAHGNFVLNEVTVEVASAADFSDARKLEFASAKADHEQDDKSWPASAVIDGKPETGWAIGPQFGKDHWIVVTLKSSLATIGGTSTDAPSPQYIRVTLSHNYGKEHTLGRFKLSLQTGLEPPLSLPETISKALATAPEKRSEEQRQAILDHVSSLESPTKETLAKLDALKKKEPPKPELTARVIAQRINSPRKTFVLKRGEFLHPLEDLEVVPAAFSTLPPMKSRTETAAADRLDLARWLVSNDNPLTPRVTVNHVWRLLFGNGIVRTPNDFGVRGERPTHPALLDWLSAEFIHPTSPLILSTSQTTTKPQSTQTGSGIPWSRKLLIKRIVMSSTYQQSSVARPELRDIDPQNTLLARQNRLRVEGEIVRDINLEVAGLLSKRVGGPSVFPPLPPGIAELSYAGNFKWTDSKGEDRFRRGMYTFFKRTAPHPNLTTFDCPDANLTCVERRASNTPLQALTSLNNEQFSEASRAFARRLLTSPAEGDSGKLTLGFRLCVSRSPRSDELNELTALLGSARDWYRLHPDAAKSLIGSDAAPMVKAEENASWIATARILLNLDEFITRE